LELIHFAEPDRLQLKGCYVNVTPPAGMKMMKYEITFEGNPAEKDLRSLDAGIEAHAQATMGSIVNKQLTFFLRDEQGAIVGGVHGNCGSFGWLYVSTLWVSERVRGNGHGSRLMQQIEEAAIRAGCVNSYLNTFTFQAPEFYKKLGYTVFAELESFPPGHSRIYLRKSLIDAAC
jgi:GNAT superfamily N-acetyltransferase